MKILGVSCPQKVVRLFHLLELMFMHAKEYNSLPRRPVVP